MTTTTDDRGVNNMYATEPPMIVTEETGDQLVKGERLNGRLAMLGVMAAVGAYAVTGQIIPGIW